MLHNVITPWIVPNINIVKVWSPKAKELTSTKYFQKYLIMKYFVSKEMKFTRVHHYQKKKEAYDPYFIDTEMN